MAFAHDNGVVHRNLKPGNVLLASDGEGWTAKVADFGLTKVLDDDPSVRSTRAGLPMGTPSYMPPEQIASARDVDHRADLWSLGCLLYEVPPVALLGAASIGLAGLASVGAVFAVLLLGWALSSDDDCRSWLPGTIGYARVGPLFFRDEGESWELRRTLELYDDLPREGNAWSTDHEVVCTLPRGTVVELDQAPVKAGRTGVWVPVSTGSYTLPEE